MATIDSYPQDWREARRRRALELAQQGWRQRRVAEALGVHESAVSRWLTAVCEQGSEALCARPHTGAPPKLTPAQLQMMPEFLSHGAEAYGFRGDVLTCARIVKIIKWEFGVSYHRSHVSRLMKQLEWTPQKPIERATQRDEDLIERWRTEVWPELKKRPAGSTANLFLWTNRAFTCCRQSSRPTRRAGTRPCCACLKHAIICR